jgi:O-6-methylguanine DNA methyltransferase|uniref:methylated-DNA--[protein]-cysteine S-methyltransferase n=1 Tax=Aliarcobacter sp. TaxID=2321116 RepID=UPI0040481F63
MREYKSQTKEIITTTTFSTPIGEMFAAASKKGIIMLCFFTPFNIEAKIATLKNTLDADVIPANNEIFDVLKNQLEEYFNKKRTTFEIPLQLIGSPFQVKCWKELLNIPYGKTISYKQQALNIEQEKAHRAVANANAQNMISILVPCHRVIASDGSLSGYNGGVEKKEFLLKLESINDK